MRITTILSFVLFFFVFFGEAILTQAPKKNKVATYGKGKGVKRYKPWGRKHRRYRRKRWGKKRHWGKKKYWPKKKRWGRRYKKYRGPRRFRRYGRHIPFRCRAITNKRVTITHYPDGTKKVSKEIF
eukprot:TRINITY_DN2392_c0_g1_i1.p1 TRINITY_DN2392_c0_g1~~TRINITY_DN2392_c0_g1_i1.p1  ORF type:complete len:126 (+),score=40.79 TRINITY_DN2392_c0_g1_i1:122-499(+)